MPSSYETLSIRAWLQGSHVQPAAATIRLTLDPAGTPSTHDWSVTAGTRWASLDAMITAWNTALAGAATVSRYTNSYTHRANIKVVTSGAVAYQIAWSHAGDGTAIRDRLGPTGNVGTTASGSVWADDTRGDFVTWLGVAGLTRSSTRYRAAASVMASGVVETQATGDRDDVVQMACELRFGAPAGAPGLWLGHKALEAFLDDLWTEAWCQDDVWMLAAAPDGDSTERWYVRFPSATVELRPEQLDATAPHRMWRLPLSLVAEAAP